MTGICLSCAVISGHFGNPNVLGTRQKSSLKFVFFIAINFGQEQQFLHFTSKQA
jgi:hypothetical protein